MEEHVSVPAAGTSTEFLTKLNSLGKKTWPEVLRWDSWLLGFWKSELCLQKVHLSSRTGKIISATAGFASQHFMAWVYAGRSDGKATSSGLKTFGPVSFSCLPALNSLTQVLYLRNGSDSFILFFGPCHVQNRQTAP